MKVNSQLERAQLENLTSLPSAATAGRICWNTTDGKAYLDDVTNWRAFLRNDQKAIIGNHGTAANNIRFHRGASGVLQLVSGADATAEGTLSTALNQISRHENYADAGKPAAGNLGRLAYITDTGFLNVDNGSAWKEIVDSSSTQTISGKTSVDPTLSATGIFAEIATPANPSAGYLKLYAKSDENFYYLNSAGLEKALAASANPTQQVFLSGSGTYTTPAGVKYIKVRMVGGGGGGGGSSGAGSNDGGDGGAGGDSAFGTSLLIAGGGLGGYGFNGSPNGGGSPTINSPAVGTGVTGGGSAPGGIAGTAGYISGGSGGPTMLGGTGSGGGPNLIGNPGVANTGGGGGGGGSPITGFAGGGGGGGAGVDAIIPSPGATYAYAVGAGGTGGTVGTGGSGAGGDGGSGYIEVTEYY